MPTKNLHIKYGLYTGALLGILSVVFLITNTLSHSVLQVSIFFALLLLGIFISTHFFAKQNPGSNTFKDLFINGFKTTAVITILLVLIGILALQFFPSIKKNNLDNWEKEAFSIIEKDSATAINNIPSITKDPTTALKLSDSIQQKAVTEKKDFLKNKDLFASKFNTIFIGQNIFSTMLIGVLASALSAFFLRKKI